MKHKNLRSDAALRRADNSETIGVYLSGEPGNRVIVLWDPRLPEESVAEIRLKDIINKRKPLKGIKAVLSGKTSVKRKAGKRK